MNIKIPIICILMGLSTIASDAVARAENVIIKNGVTYEIQKRGIEIIYTWNADNTYKNAKEKPYIFVSTWNFQYGSGNEVYLLKSPAGQIRYYKNDDDQTDIRSMFKIAYISLPCEQPIRQRYIDKPETKNEKRQAYYANKANHEYQVALKRYFAEIITTEQECSVKFYELGETSNKAHAEAILLNEQKIDSFDTRYNDISAPIDGRGEQVVLIESEPVQIPKP